MSDRAVRDAANQRGRCVVCAKQGPEERRRDFLCGQCADPEQVRTYCARCGERRQYVPQMDRDILELLLPPEVGLELGLALALDGCPACCEYEQLGVVTIYGITG